MRLVVAGHRNPDSPPANWQGEHLDVRLCRTRCDRAEASITLLKRADHLRFCARRISASISLESSRHSWRSAGGSSPCDCGSSSPARSGSAQRCASF